jgi:hypothetical protein
MRSALPRSLPNNELNVIEAAKAAKITMVTRRKTDAQLYRMEKVRMVQRSYTNEQARTVVTSNGYIDLGTCT